MEFDINKRLSKVVKGSLPSSTVAISDRAKELSERGHHVLNFSAGRASESTPSYIIEAAHLAMLAGDTHQTLARGTRNFRMGISQKLSRDNHIKADPYSEIIATNGVKQGLTIALLSVLNPGDEVIVEDPCFVSYKQLISYFGGITVSVPLRKENGFRWNEDELRNAISSKTKAILFNSPHNPTGTVHLISDLQLIADVAKEHDLFVLADEVYERLVWGGRSHVSIATLPGMKHRVITLNSLTKSFCMGGWRIGFIYANATLINNMEKLQQHLITSCNSFVQHAASVALSDPPGKEILDYWNEWEKKCAFFTKELNDIQGLSCVMPEGGFYAWVDISQLNKSSDAFINQLLEEEKVALIPGQSFGEEGQEYVRITCVKSWEEIKEGITRIKKFVNKLQSI